MCALWTSTDKRAPPGAGPNRHTAQEQGFHILPNFAVFMYTLFTLAICRL
jgi:hypothetical protein